jgi:hypothetical protein
MSLTLRTTTELVSMFEDRFWFLAVVLGFGCVSFLFTFVLCLSGEILLFRFGCSGPLFCSSWWWWWSFVSGQISSHHLVFYFFCSWFSVSVFVFGFCVSLTLFILCVYLLLSGRVVFSFPALVVLFSWCSSHLPTVSDSGSRWQMVDLGFWSVFQVGVAFVLLGISCGYVTSPCRKLVSAASGCVKFWYLVLDFGETHTACGYRCWFLWRVGVV